ncbi:MAG: hypothetical protein COB35_12690 [Gammaproteobacteria bacterium]|nr:MAG: hypothetical protein COB35_12690 [Gammaproteobacteria bacterium]
MINNFSYLNDDDLSEFTEYFGTDLESMLVAGSCTRNRLERYIPESEYFTLRVVLTALVRDFEIPCIRQTLAIALTIYAMQIEQGRPVSADVKEIVNLELALLIKHLQDEEKITYNRDLAMVINRWNEYMTDPHEFTL